METAGEDGKMAAAFEKIQFRITIVAKDFPKDNPVRISQVLCVRYAPLG
ncbi:MAG: hypothetical protein ACLU4N_10460 [Butyricimonas faecihominis]